MFDINDHEMIKKLIRTKKPDAFVVPLYVKVNKDRYGLSELKTIETFSTSFRVGFGAIVSIFDKHSYPESAMFYHDCITAFSEYDEKKQIDEKFIVVESTFLDTEEFEKEKSVLVKEMLSQVNYYYEMLYTFVKNQYQELRKKRIQDMMESQSISS